MMATARRKTLTITAVMAVLSLSAFAMIAQSDDAVAADIIASGGDTNGTSADYTWSLDSDSVMRITGYNRTYITPTSLAPPAPFNGDWEGDAHGNSDFYKFTLDTAPYIYFMNCMEVSPGTYKWTLSDPIHCLYESPEQTDKSLPTTLVNLDGSGNDFIGTWESVRTLATGQITGSLWATSWVITPEELSINEVIIDSSTADVIWLPYCLEGKILTISENTANISGDLLCPIFAADGVTELTTADMPGRSFIATYNEGRGSWIEIDRTTPTNPVDLTDTTDPVDLTDKPVTNASIFCKVASKIALAVISIIQTALSHFGLR